MGMYSKPALDLLGALINRDNPRLKTQLSSANILLLGGPYTTGLGSSGRNSRVIINGVTGAGIAGKKEFFYDRLNIGDLFKNITIVFDADNKSTKLKDLLPPLNAQYGLNLTEADLTAPDTALDYGYTATPVTFTMSAGSLTYRGSLTATWSRKPVGVYPQSGPGSKTLLMGSLQEGYFGVVSKEEMMTSGEFYASFFDGKAVNGSGVLVNNTLFWLKFALDGKFVFVPSHNMISNISWDTLDAYGAVNADAQYPMFVQKNDDQFLFQLRLPKFSDTLEVPPSRTDPTSDANRLFNKVHKQAYGNGQWAALTTIDMANAFVWWNKRNDVATPYPVYIAPFNQASVSTSPPANRQAWRPVLELADAADYLMPMRNIQAKLEIPVRSFAFAITSVIDSNMLQAMKNVTATLERAVPAPVLYRPTANVFKAAQDFRATNPVRSFAFSFTATYDKRIDLATTNGELSGF